MDRHEEYHDPDYPEAPAGAAEAIPPASEEETAEKIRRIVRREFSLELEARENDVMMIDQRSLMARRLLQRLRYVLVNNFYAEERLKLTAGQIQDEVATQTEPRARAAVSALLRDNQRRLHPSVRKLLGKQSSPVELHEILGMSRAPRNKARKDYSAMIQSKNYTIPAETGNSLRPACTDPAPSTSQPMAEPDPAPSTSRPIKLPRKIQPKLTNVLTLDEATRNQSKHRFRIIIGNTSKYCPPASSADRSTHKWLLYVRGPAERPDLSAVLTSVTVRLHHSYAPHHVVHIDRPPFHVSRRGWGEFSARVSLQFTLPQLNRPHTLTHNIKLDRNYTGLQTLGAETIVDVWLYSTPEMLPYEFTELNKVNIKEEPLDDVQNPPQHEEQNIFDDTDKTDNWLEFFSNTTELDVDEMIIKPNKKPENNDINQINDIENDLENHIITKDVKTELDLDKQEATTERWNEVTVKSKDELPNELLTQQTSPKKRIMKYMDPTTGKIYYLEMDRKLDLTKVQEIIINSKGNVKTAKISPIKPNGLKNVRKTKKGISLLKPEVKSLLKNETVKSQSLKKKFSHIQNDHCYLGNSDICNSVSDINSYFQEEVTVKSEKSIFEELCVSVQRLHCVKVAVDFCLRKIPLVCSDASDADYLKCFPFVVESYEKYWKLDVTKRRNVEWSRAKLINRILTEYLNTSETIWRTKQILIYSRLHGYYPVIQDSKTASNDAEWSSWNDLENRKESNIRELYPNATDITSLTVFNVDSYKDNLSECIELDDGGEEVVEIVKWDERNKVKKEVLPDLNCDLPVLPVTDHQEQLRFMYLERTCADIGIELRNENIGNGYCYSAVHTVLLSAVRSFVSELLRSSLATKLLVTSKDSAWPGPLSSVSLQLEDVYCGASQGRLTAVTRRALGAHNKHVDNL